MPRTVKQSIVFTLMTVFFMVYCFPVALCLQVFFVGPLVRWIFRYMLSMTNK